MQRDARQEGMELTLSLRPRRFLLKSDRCHLGSQRSGSGGGPGCSGSKSLGSRICRFLFLLDATGSAPSALLASPLAILRVPAGAP
jgi:hypothetical protein